MAGLFDTYNLASLFIAMTYSPFLQHLFQQDPELPFNFYDHGFLFEFLHVDVVEDIFYYDISYGSEFKMSFAFCGVDTTQNCNPSSNLDFVNFIWQNYERFTFAKYCLTFVRRDYLAPPELVCLKHYRAESEGWRYDIHCPACVTRTQNILRPATRCQRPNDCSCSICRRQPPSLLASASHTLFHMVLELDRFALTIETTYDQYIMALRSRRLSVQQLLHPNIPHIRLRFRCSSFSKKFHSHCPGPKIWWDVKMKRTLRSEAEAIRSLVLLKDLFWCNHCRRGLFFSVCPHPNLF